MILKPFTLLIAVCAFVSFESSCAGEVKIKQVDDGFRFEIDGELFTHWQTKDWKVGYLYPVVGPDGENITRNYPMIDDVEGEQTDHPHHRSIRFSHRKVNGFSFWAPDSHKDGTTAEIKFVKVEKIDGGELVIWNDWLGNGKLLLQEKLRLNVISLENKQVLLDYDVELTAPNEDVTFFDEKDGGLGVRVPAWMVVKNRHTKTGTGTILNSEGDKNTDSWGKRASWSSYFGPNPKGKVLGITVFDHPSNMRYPTHWHARDYGLNTANRFGKGFFEAKSGAKKGDGDYTIKKGETLKLRHRIYFHHGDPETAKVAEKFAAYAKE